ncbi:MAG: rhomboid family intramembrane serine protease [Candidatus Latescibacteria bacterium]|nr:rhomboid family intramembrane serine protease [Candidatus Latescibacterota bacterium]NIO27289.1 rhomboid family intramembrane serine protease [Candidatus Latescibacterota bacterium]NIO54813.1 rhomboid family intramembrane serine protease [Candidatus Latescibacterota bacterium]NIT00896.1 rhomboid family intramembrane serine protease [Candidatus Latescibacterota bacterium]NIT37819.1 rhomboid family intramembrane serine protease [Candidatus Latescibacterota bacterium]
MYFFYYIPVRIDEELRKFPAITYFCCFLCLAIFFGNRYYAGQLPVDFYNLIYIPGQSNLFIAMAAAFLHFGYLHLISNMVFLLVFGRYVEDRMGAVFYAILFFSSSALGNVLQGLFNIHVLHQPDVGIIGASGAISGILGAFAVRFYASRLEVAFWAFMPLQAYNRAGRVEIPALLAIALWFVLQLVRGLVQAGGVASNVAYITHIAGFMWAVGLVLLVGEHRRAKIETIWRRAQRYVEKGEAYAAQGELIDYLSLRPDDDNAVATLARAKIIVGDTKGANENYRKACERLLRKKQRGRAEDLFREALHGFPNFVLSPGKHLDLAFGLERNLKHKLAIRAYENFARRYPLHKEAPFALLRSANLYWNTLDDIDEAARCYKKLIELYPDDEWVEFAREQVRLLSFGAV